MGLPAARRVTFAALTAGILIGTGALAWWVQQPQYRVLYSGLGGSDAGAVIEYLKGEKIPYRVSDAGGNIEVASATTLRDPHGARRSRHPAGRGRRLRDLRQADARDDRLRPASQLPARAPGRARALDRRARQCRVGARAPRDAGALALRLRRASAVGLGRAEAPGRPYARARADRGRRAPSRGERRGPAARRRDGRRRERTGVDPRRSRAGSAELREGHHDLPARARAGLQRRHRDDARARARPGTCARARDGRARLGASREDRGELRSRPRRGAEREALEGDERAARRRRRRGERQHHQRSGVERHYHGERSDLGARGHGAQLRDQQGDEPARRADGRDQEALGRGARRRHVDGRGRSTDVRAAAAGGDGSLSRAHQARGRLQRGARRPDRGRERAVPGGARTRGAGSPEHARARRRVLRRALAARGPRRGDGRRHDRDPAVPARDGEPCASRRPRAVHPAADGARHRLRRQRSPGPRRHAPDGEPEPRAHGGGDPPVAGAESSRWPTSSAGVDKAAVLLLSLGEDVAAEVFRHLDDSEVRMVDEGARSHPDRPGRAPADRRAGLSQAREHHTRAPRRRPALRARAREPVDGDRRRAREPRRDPRRAQPIAERRSDGSRARARRRPAPMASRVCSRPSIRRSRR